MDDLDYLAITEEFSGPAVIAAARRPDGPAACGECLNCDATLLPGARWCDADCARDWERHERAYLQRPML